ncbi:hypothetical protein EVAR_3487_1 [Eumeta japonica]|uniref:Uncharacterized protein n=1 Tax=Eumeta variegata TaxID=151549 RepID=A0A4C1SSS4_EUMVA|nr:hypothetical protein EVAR_3487_1 [Eumeta japonica]
MFVFANPGVQSPIERIRRRIGRRTGQGIGPGTKVTGELRRRLRIDEDGRRRRDKPSSRARPRTCQIKKRFDEAMFGQSSSDSIGRKRRSIARGSTSVVVECISSSCTSTDHTFTYGPDSYPVLVSNPGPALDSNCDPGLDFELRLNLSSSRLFALQSCSTSALVAEISQKSEAHNFNMTHQKFPPVLMRRDSDVPILKSSAGFHYGCHHENECENRVGYTNLRPPDSRVSTEQTTPRTTRPALKTLGRTPALVKDGTRNLMLEIGHAS